MNCQGMTIRTISGREISLLDPRPEQILIEDIAHSLSKLCRFNGHIDRFYSVADHSVFVSHICPPEYALVGLLHDATEAYLGDMISPVKKLLRTTGSMAYDVAEERLWGAICQRFELDPASIAQIKHADAVALATENRDLRGLASETNCGDPLPEPSTRIVRPSPEFYTRQQFLGRYQELRPTDTVDFLALATDR